MKTAIILLVLLIANNLQAQNASHTFQWVVKPIYDDVEDFYGNYASVSDGTNWGVIDKQGKVIIPLEYNEVGEICNGILYVKKSDKSNFTYINLAGKQVIPTTYKYCTNFSEGIATVKIKDDYVCIDTTGKTLFIAGKNRPFEFQKNGIAIFEQKVQIGEFVKHIYGLMDRKGKIIKAPTFSFMKEFNEGFAAVEIADGITNNKWGFVDTKGNWIIKPIYASALDFYNGVAIIKDTATELYGIIDKKGKTVIPLQYENISIVNDSLCLVGERSYWDPHFLNIKTKKITKPTLTVIRALSKNRLSVELGDNLGISDIEGNLLLDYQFSRLRHIEGNRYFARQKDSEKWGIIELIKK